MTTPNTKPTYAPLTAGSKVKVEKGCAERGVAKNVSAEVVSVTLLGAEYGHQVKVVLRFLNGFSSGKSIVLYARHENRLSDAVINLNDGNPLHKVKVVRRNG